MNDKMVIVSVGEFAKQFKKMIKASKSMSHIKKNKLLDKQFIERIMLAVSQVNGCSICSYEHTKIAFKAGISQEEIDGLLSGNLADIPDEEKMAVIFAQHYAHTQGKPDSNALFRLRTYYGREKADAIIKVTDMIMFGNSYGIAWLTLKSRLKNKPVKKSGISRELTILIIPFAMILLPLAIVLISIKLLKR